ncbi:glycine zipper 2TM domain-containing protein [Pontixanthobacter luteolus]|uniref:glycine zipper 2TM domain-containing protein n=1 Tax=Pontixanthobacter luteolus TaxID=295089 RepID=UPI0023035200|nr:glycine zipper 2TM domain-containing protein [Pontixanthobacter luteolus]
MTTRTIVSLGAATSALFAAAPLAAQDMTYGGGYEYAQPVPAAASAPSPVPAPEVVFRQEPVVQPIPVPAAPTGYAEADYGADYEVEDIEVEYSAPAMAPGGYPVQYAGPHHGGHRAIAHPGPQHPGAYPQHAQFDHAAWLEECEARYADANDDGNGGLIGGILGAAAGGLIGNRVADSERLAGTLIGAGVGGLAGLAIGSAISAAGKDRKRGDAAEYCENWLNRHLGGYYPQGYYPHYYQQQYILVPYTVAVPQRAVVREYVTEEYVDVPVTTYERVPAKRHIKARPAPKPVKQAPVKRVKSMKGK